MPNSVQMYHLFCLASLPHVSIAFAFGCKSGLKGVVNFSDFSAGSVKIVLLKCSAVMVWNHLFFSRARIMAQICWEGVFGERWATRLCQGLSLACLKIHLALALYFLKFARFSGEGQFLTLKRAFLLFFKALKQSLFHHGT